MGDHFFGSIVVSPGLIVLLSVTVTLSIFSAPEGGHTFPNRTKISSPPNVQTSFKGGKNFDFGPLDPVWFGSVCSP